MSGGVVVVVGVVAAFVVCETLLPKALSALWKRLRAAWSQPGDAAPIVASAEVAAAPAAPAAPPETSLASPRAAPPRAASPSEPPAAFAPPDAEVPQEPKEKVLPTESAPSDESPRQKAQRLWNEARAIAHGFKPDWERDRDYLEKIHGAARLGHLQAMVKLGEYAARRGAMIEAYYWTFLADLSGAEGLSVVLRQARAAWMAQGCPNEHANVYEFFSEEQSAFARAVLRLQCGIDAQYARARLNELSARGVWEARLYMESRRQGARKVQPGGA